MEIVSEAFDLDWFDFLEVFADGGQDGEVVVEAGASDWKVEIAEFCSFDLQSVTLSAEQLTIAKPGVVAGIACDKRWSQFALPPGSRLSPG